MLRLSGALIGVALFAQSAAAVPITPGPVPVGGPTAVLVAGNVYTDSPTFLANATIENQYNFLSSGLVTITTGIALNSNPPAQGPFGIKDLTIQWFNSANTLLGTLNVTNGSGVVTNPSDFLSLNLPASALLYHIIVSGKALGSGGNYTLNVFVPGDQEGQLPLPPALLLFGSALIGLTALGRRKRQGAKI